MPERVTLKSPVVAYITLDHSDPEQKAEILMLSSRVLALLMQHDVPAMWGLFEGRSAVMIDGTDPKACRLIALPVLAREPLRLKRLDVAQYTGQPDRPQNFDDLCVMACDCPNCSPFKNAIVPDTLPETL